MIEMWNSIKKLIDPNFKQSLYSEGKKFRLNKTKKYKFNKKNFKDKQKIILKGKKNFLKK